MSDLTRIENKLDKVLERLDEHGKILVKHEVLHNKNTDDLAEHIRRTDLAEQAIQKQEEAIESRIKPIEHHVHGVNTLLKAVAFLLMVATAVLSYVRLKS